MFAQALQHLRHAIVIGGGGIRAICPRIHKRIGQSASKVSEDVCQVILDLFYGVLVCLPVVRHFLQVLLVFLAKFAEGVRAYELLQRVLIHGTVRIEQFRHGIFQG